MSTNYMGWKVPEDIIIVAKECRVWKDGKYETVGKYQGYVVEPGNTSMLQTAHGWAKWVERNGKFHPETGTYDEEIEHPGSEHHFKNEGFTLELLETAGGSSQGGKLSFWNCKVSKDGKEFIVGIASEYLLDILLHNDFKNGVCQSTLSFARCKGGVGMMNKSMPSYQQFLKDEEHRAAMKKGKTRKRIPGHLYSTLTDGDVHFTTFYSWYTPVYKEEFNYWRPRTLIGFKKMEKPDVLYWAPCYDSQLTKKSEYLEKYNIYFRTGVPARTDSGAVAEIDISDEAVLDKYLKKCFVTDVDNYTFDYHYKAVGLGLSGDSYELPQWIRDIIIKKGYKLID